MIHLQQKFVLLAMAFLMGQAYPQESNAQQDGKMNISITKNDDGKFSAHYEVAHDKTVNLSSQRFNRIEGTDWYLVHEKKLGSDITAVFCIGALSAAFVFGIWYQYKHPHIQQPDLIDLN